MGRRAAERLMNADDGEGIEELFDFELITRQSTGKISG
jgi:DNA-binding LacI/PurR family transcriptional regulator